MPTTSDPHSAPALHARLAPVLADLTFPARRWQTLAVADLYGCDTVTRALVLRLPERTYVAFGDLVAVLAAVLAGVAVPDQPSGPAGAPRPGAVVQPVARTVVPPPARTSRAVASRPAPGPAARLRSFR